jgi:hypothetical protein
MLRQIGMRRLLAALAAAAMVLADCGTLAGCGRGGVGTGSPRDRPDFDRRAKDIVEAWHAAGLDTAWKTGFVPLESLTQLEWDMSILKDSSNIDRASEVKSAIGNGWYRLAGGPLPTGAPDNGQVKFADGTAMSVPVVSAEDAYTALHNPAAPPVASCGTPSCALTITGARLATTTIRSSRGPATVPAWIFTVSEVTVPAIRVAVAPSAVTPLPDPDKVWSEAPGFTRLEAVVRRDDASLVAAARRLTVHFLGGACEESRSAHVYQTPELVVLGVIVTPRGRGDCISLGVPSTLDIELAEPVGERVVLDVATSQPVTLDDCGPSGYRCGRLPGGPSAPPPQTTTK